MWKYLELIKKVVTKTNKQVDWEVFKFVSSINFNLYTSYLLIAFNNCEVKKLFLYLKNRIILWTKKLIIRHALLGQF